MRVLRIILFPFTFLYGLIVMLRNAMYDAGLFKSFKFELPIISVGNLTAGGAGKSPMTEYLVNLLHNQYKIAILSRGYGRKTTGFYTVTKQSNAEQAGDEPLQFKSKFPSIEVAVCEKRVTGIRNLQDTNDLIILDDAYQHREVVPGFSILLFDYTSLMKWQWLLPTGDLREPLSGKKRADCIVITKTPESLDAEARRIIAEKVKPLKNQPLFCSYISYGELTSLNGEHRPLDTLSDTTSVLLLTGIANPVPLINELTKYTKQIYHQQYPDHHIFTTKNMIKLASEFNNLNSSDKIVITTEKDLQRLKSPHTKGFLEQLPVYFLPVKAALHEPEKAAFDALILKYATKHRRNS